MPTSTRRRRGGRRQRNPPVDATQAPVPEPELPGRTGYVPAPLRLPDALTSTPSAAPRAPADARARRDLEAAAQALGLDADGYDSSSSEDVPLAALGATWSYLYLASGNLLVPVAIHALWNARVFAGTVLGL